MNRGCIAVIESHKSKDGNEWDEFCRRICAPDSVFCPKHKLLEEDRPNEANRKLRKMLAGREKRHNARKALETSPLRVKSVEMEATKGKKRSKKNS